MNYANLILILCPSCAFGTNPRQLNLMSGYGISGFFGNKLGNLIKGAILNLNGFMTYGTDKFVFMNMVIKVIVGFSVHMDRFGKYIFIGHSI